MLTEDQARAIRDLVQSPGWALLTSAIERDASAERYVSTLESALIPDVDGQTADPQTRQDALARAVWERRALRFVLDLPHRWLRSFDTAAQPATAEPPVGRRA